MLMLVLRTNLSVFHHRQMLLARTLSKADTMVICKQCAPIIARGPISEVIVADALNKTSAGSQILENTRFFS